METGLKSAARGGNVTSHERMDVQHMIFNINLSFVSSLCDLSASSAPLR